MKILILGGDGFIGSHLLSYHTALGDTCQVVDINSLRTNPESQDYQYIRGNLRTHSIDKYLDNYSPDLVYNCVAVATPHYYVKYPHDTYELDFKINWENICKPLISKKIPFVHFSTSEVYGKRWESEYCEDDSDLILGPTHKSRWIYANSKIMLEQLIMSGESREFIIIRPQNFFGWNMDWLPSMAENQDKTWIPRLPAQCLDALLSNKPIPCVSPGNQKRCYTHISDAIAAIDSLNYYFDTCKGQIFNVGNPNNEITVKDFINKFRDSYKSITGNDTQEPIQIDGTKLYGKGYEDSERRLFSSSKIEKYTKWQPTVNIDFGIKMTIKQAVDNFGSQFGVSVKK